MRRLIAVLAAALAAGCAGYSPSDVKPGQTAEEVARSMGPPTARYSLPDGRQRIEYARGPMGKHTYMIDLDAQGRVTGWEQVLTERNFESVAPGMTREQVLLKLGRPAEHLLIPRQGFDIWNYRYDASPLCRWYQVSMRGDAVAEAGYGNDPMCDAGDRADRE